MPVERFRNRRILVVEDEYMLATDLQRELEAMGAIVIGPAGQLDAALDLVQGEDAIEAAILDINLGGEEAYSVADLLISRKIPFVFATGYERSTIPARFKAVPICEKPINLEKIVATIFAVAREGTLE
ncbi:response regulator [Rhizobium grahamii]|uniref:Response regulator n=2 Tax=Rhizobium grahamii TaxID=1120045 RepID=A0A370KGI7_9HYPH|nr:response regulator [Rhizobium grahamii]